MQAAAKFGMAPSTFWACDQADQAYMMGLVIAEASMAAWDSQEAEREAKRKKHG